MPELGKALSKTPILFCWAGGGTLLPLIDTA